MKVRIKTVPRERQIDGIQLDNLIPGSVREVSASLATWLVAQGYAELEMRTASSESRDAFRDDFSDLYGLEPDRRRRD
jgi:hypothetical protein